MASLAEIIKLRFFDKKSFNYFKYTNYRSVLTGKPSGNAHAYRSISNECYGAVRHSICEYIEKWIQEDGSSLYFIVSRYWQINNRHNKSLISKSEIISVRKMKSLTNAWLVWNGVT